MVSSVMSQIGLADAALYSASKGAVRAMSRALAMEFAVAKTPIRVNTIFPGCVDRSEEHTSELQSLMRISYAVFCLKKNNNTEPNRSAHKKKQTQHNKKEQD